MIYSIVGILGLALGLALVPKWNSDTSNNIHPIGAVDIETPEQQVARRVLRDKIEGVIFGAAVGDALGRVTEFIDTTDAITKKYGPKGVTSFKSFTPGDWVMHPYTRECIAAYTDDTVMSLIVLEEALCRSEEEPLIDAIDARFRKLFGKNAYTIDPLYQVRAHGIQNRAACTKEQQKKIVELSPEYDRVYDCAVAQEGGCGSVMRAWPLGLIFQSDSEKVIRLADYQSRITHRHPMARAASAALAVGIAALLQGGDSDAAVEKMIAAARCFDEAEKLYKQDTHQVLEAASLAEDKLLTSDMIAYAAEAARNGVAPELVLGTHNTKSSNYRSTKGFLLGWAADEAIAAAVYVFLRNPYDMGIALQEAVNSPGDSDSIATLTAALVGAHTGWSTFKNTGFDYNSLESKVELEKLSDAVFGYNKLRSAKC